MAKKKLIKRKSKELSKTKKKVRKKTKKKVPKDKENSKENSKEKDSAKALLKRVPRDKFDPKTAEIYKSWPKWGDKFLAALSKRGGYYAAAHTINIDPSTTQRYKRSCKEFREACEDIYHAETDDLEACMMHRAKHGNDDLVLFEGEPVTIVNEETGERDYLYKRKYETALSIFMLKGRRRETYYPEGGYVGGTADDKALAVRESIVDIMKVMGAALSKAS